MKSKNLIIHQLKCEWLCFRKLVALWTIFLTWSGWMLFSWNEPWRSYEDGGIRQNQEILYVIAVCFIILFALLLFKRDDYRDVRAFWQTRPMPETQLYTAKFLFFTGVVAVPLCGLFFINIWMYDSLFIALLSGIEILAWNYIIMAIIALLMQHSAGIFSFIKPIIWISSSVAITLLIILASSAWLYFLSNRTELSLDLALPLILILHAAALNLLWFKNIQSRKNHLRFKHYLCIPVITVASIISTEFILNGLSTPPDQLSLDPKNNTIHLSNHSSNYLHGKVQISLKNGSNEYLHRVISQDLTCDNNDIKLSNIPNQFNSIHHNFAPIKLTKDKRNRTSSKATDQYRDIGLNLLLPKNKSIPKTVRITGHYYIELAKADKIMNIPFTQPGSAKANGIEFTWRKKTVYYNLNTIYIKRSYYPFLTYKHLRPRFPKPYCFVLTNGNEFSPVDLGSSFARGLSSHSRVTSNFELTSEKGQATARWIKNSTLHIYQFTPTRIVKVPIDLTLELRLKES